MRALVAAMAVPLLLCSVPAVAGRTAIDEDGEGGQVKASFAGYCDYNGEDCGGGLVLPYRVAIGSADFTDIVTVHGNGLLTFGEAVDFFDPAVRDQIDIGNVPALTDYARTLVSAGQSNQFDSQSNDLVFFQSARLGFDPANGVIIATWFTCVRPTGPGICPESNRFSLTLTPRRGGFAGHFNFIGQPENADRGYVSDGVFTAVGNDFFLPAQFDGIAPGVPEPGSWALLIAGFGMTGVALRRRKRAAAAFA